MTEPALTERLTTLEADVRRYLDITTKLAAVVERLMQRVEGMDDGDGWKRGAA